MQDKKSNKKIFRRKIIIWIISIIALVLITRYMLNQIRINRFNKVVSEYIQIDNYQDAQDLFERDLKNNKLKYFTYGMFYNKSYSRKLKKEYGLEVFHMGCVIEGRLSKYNFYVDEQILDNDYRDYSFFNRADSIMTYFQEALDTKDYGYLTSNTSDSVFVTLGLLNDSIRENYDSRYLYDNFSDAIASFNYLSTNSTDDDRDSLIYYFRKIESVPSDKEPFNLRFCFIRRDSKYYFNELVIL